MFSGTETEMGEFSIVRLLFTILERTNMASRYEMCEQWDNGENVHGPRGHATYLV